MADAQRPPSLEEKIDAIYRSVERTRKMFLWTLILALVTLVLPLIGLMFAIPAYLKAVDLNGLL